MLTWDDVLMWIGIAVGFNAGCALFFLVIKPRLERWYGAERPAEKGNPDAK
jgi:hypothetical protein